MEIEVTLKISNKAIFSRSRKYDKVNYMVNDGWTIAKKQRTLFFTIYSFSKII